jgi:hypothetical protein
MLTQLICDAPRRRLSPLAQIQTPSAGHISEIYTSGMAAVVGSEVDYILDVNVVAANCERLEPVRKAMTFFSENAINCQGEIERRNSPRIKAATCDPGTLARKR